MNLFSIGIMVRVFANCQEDCGSISDRLIPKTLKMVLDGWLFGLFMAYQPL